MAVDWEAVGIADKGFRKLDLDQFEVDELCTLHFVLVLRLHDLARYPRKRLWIGALGLGLAALKRTFGK